MLQLTIAPDCRPWSLPLNKSWPAALLIGCLLLIGTCGAYTCNEYQGCNFTCNEYKTMSPDGTCCLYIHNLQESNRVQISGPAIVDYNETTGNLLVRGPLPLIVRNGTGNAGNCTNYSEWRFAYTEFNTMMQNSKSFAPAYFPEDKKMKLLQEMADFSLDDFEIIDIALLNHDVVNALEFDTLQKAYGGNYSSCSDPLKNGVLSGQKANLVWSEFAFCNNLGDSCNQTIDMNVGNSCSFGQRIDMLAALMGEKDPVTGKKRLIYYHCVLGSDRTGSVTIGYLQHANRTLSFAHALAYARFLGKEDQGDGAPWPVNNDALNVSLSYCRMIGANCGTKEAVRIMLPGRETHSHLPGQEDAVVTPVPQQIPVPAKTPVPSVHYNPTRQEGVTF